MERSFRITTERKRLPEVVADLKDQIAEWSDLFTLEVQILNEYNQLFALQRADFIRFREVASQRSLPSALDPKLHTFGARFHHLLYRSLIVQGCDRYAEAFVLHEEAIDLLRKYMILFEANTTRQIIVLANLAQMAMAYDHLHESRNIRNRIARFDPPTEAAALRRSTILPTWTCPFT